MLRFQSFARIAWSCCCRCVEVASGRNLGDMLSRVITVVSYWPNRWCIFMDFNRNINLGAWRFICMYLNVFDLWMYWISLLLLCYLLKSRCGVSVQRFVPVLVCRRPHFVLKFFILYNHDSFPFIRTWDCQIVVCPVRLLSVNFCLTDFNIMCSRMFIVYLVCVLLIIFSIFCFNKYLKQFRYG